MILNENFDDKRLEEIHELYEISFPEDEKMPFRIVLQKREAGVMRLFSVEEEVNFIGFCNITLCEDALTLNYFAIVPTWQNKGYGSQVINELMAAYPQRSIVIDIEDDEIEAENTEQRRKRKSFYERLGFSVMPFRVTIFGVPSLIMSSGREYNFEEYKKIFAQVFSERGVQRLILTKEL